MGFVPYGPSVYAVFGFPETSSRRSTAAAVLLPRPCRSRCKQGALDGTHTHTNTGLQAHPTPHTHMRTHVCSYKTHNASRPSWSHGLWEGSEATLRGSIIADHGGCTGYASSVSEFMSPPSPLANCRREVETGVLLSFFEILVYFPSQSPSSHIATTILSIHNPRFLCLPFLFLSALDVPSRTWNPSLRSMFPTRLTMTLFPS
ncbi:uncharacterized protein LY79DRAFT_552336 [Colletotrichum navitas]|uniref:Uncharacterized protein n=1 Tax=Colletotrichum navitas TaxID=681940 RepID=A0AAD8PZX5_9PEZI|nr:uncharacterized protein LY79DRAFT_552336 [Colletotrichum navitas]KAK1593281.1 hypothetical protein LY79DRAFT_552336 [Colletotrichum navitas]